MKQFTFATIVGLVFAAESENARYRLQKWAPFSNQNSNVNDYDVKRQFPGMAGPMNRGQVSDAVKPELREGDELTTLKSQRNAKAAERQARLANAIKVKPFEFDKRFVEPVDPQNKKFRAPVFDVDPDFTEDKKEEEKICFEGHDFGDWKQPRVHPSWPIIRPEVQKFFNVGPDCAPSWKEKEKKVAFTEPYYAPLPLPSYYAHVSEPQYSGPKYFVPSQQEKCYQGDDYGGHNIPFPHPAPPKPDAYYEVDAFIDLGSYYGLEGYPIYDVAASDTIVDHVPVVVGTETVIDHVPVASHGEFHGHAPFHGPAPYNGQGAYFDHAPDHVHDTLPADNYYNDVGKYGSYSGW